MWAFQSLLNAVTNGSLDVDDALANQIHARYADRLWEEESHGNLGRFNRIVIVVGCIAQVMVFAFAFEEFSRLHAIIGCSITLCATAALWYVVSIKVHRDIVRRSILDCGILLCMQCNYLPYGSRCISVDEAITQLCPECGAAILPPAPIEPWPNKEETGAPHEK